jgi:hypothetical protein
MKRWRQIPEKLLHRVEKRERNQLKPKAYVAAANFGKNREQNKAPV